jgi:chromosome segregation ATPase
MSRKPSPETQIRELKRKLSALTRACNEWRDQCGRFAGRLTEEQKAHARTREHLADLQRALAVLESYENTRPK